MYHGSYILAERAPILLGTQNYDILSQHNVMGLGAHGRDNTLK